MKRKIQDPRIAQKVLDMVAVHYNTTPNILKGEDGDPVAKNVVMYILKEGLGASLKASKEAAGKKHDPDVYQAVKKVRMLVETDIALASLIEEIKTEVLMITVMPSETGSTSESFSPIRQRTTSITKELTASEKDELAPIITSENMVQIIGSVQKAVISIFLGADLLQSRDPATEVMLAKDAVVFLVWDDFPKITKAEILSAFRLDQDELYRAIGRISVCLKEDGNELKKKLKAARNAYSSTQ